MSASENITLFAGEGAAWKRIQKTLAMGGIGIWRIFRDAEGRLTFEAGAPLADFIGQPLPASFHDFSQRHMHPDEHEQIRALILECFDGGRDRCELEHRLWNVQREQWRWFTAFGEVSLRDEQGRVLALDGFILDTHERRVAQDALEENQRTQRDLKLARERLAAFIDSADLGAWDWNIQTGEATFSETWAAILGYTWDELPSSVEFWERAILPEDVERTARAVERHCAGETPLYEAEFRIRRKDGSIIWAQDRGRVVERDRDGEPLRLLGVMMDVTRQKKTEAELVESKEQLKLIITAAQIGIWDYNLTDGTIKFNDIYQRMLGYGPDELQGAIEEWESFIHPDDRAMVDDMVERALNGWAPLYECDVRMRHKAGHYVWTHDIGRVVEWDARGQATRMVGGHFDATDRKNLEDSLRTIAEQKAVLEIQMKERVRILNDIQRRVDRLIGSPCLTVDAPGPALHAAGSSAGELGAFESYLHQAFDFITTRMIWYKAVLDNIPFPIGVTDLNNRWTYLNQPALTAMGGRDLAALLSQPYETGWTDYADADLHPAGGQADGRRIFTRRLVSTNRFLRGQASSLYDERGERSGRIEIMQDVTETYEAEQRTRLMLDAMPLCCNFWDSDFNNIDSNQAAAALFDLPDQQTYMDRFYDLSPEFQPGGGRSRDLAAKYLTEAFETGYRRFEWLHQKFDGTLIPAEITLVRVAWRDGHIVAGYTRDLRELKAAQATLDRERLLLKQVLDSCPVCFVISSVDNIIKFITPFTQAFLGQAVDDDARQIFACPEEFEQARFDLTHYGAISWRPVRINNAGGQVREMLLNSFVADYYGESGILAWLMDVTELKEQARELVQARDAAEESTRAKSEFLANMSHEIRTPMNAILGLTHLVTQTELTAQQRDYLGKVANAANALLRIINDILDFSKIEAGKLEMEETGFYLEDVLGHVIDLVSNRAHEKGLEFLVAVPPGAPTGLLGDQVRLGQVLSNLASNAVKFTTRGEVSLSIETVEERDGRVMLRFLIKDTGIGLTAVQRRNLFSAFSQADTSTTRRYGGTGLGLAISKRLVEMMGGEIWCESEGSDQGSTFGFTASFGLYDQEKRYIPSHRDFTGLKALAVDDNQLALEILTAQLRSLGFTVTAASSGEEALTILADLGRRNESIDLAIMDWKMPGLNGIETTRRIRQMLAPEHLPVVIMATAYSRDEVHASAMDVGIKNVLTKPLSPSTLLNTLMNLFGEDLPEKTPRPAEGSEADLVKHLGGANILLAEDNDVNQLVAGRILKNAGFNVVIANNGREAVEKVQEAVFDLVLMDIQMPEMDGLAATQAIRQLAGRFATLPIVAMTAHAMSGDRELSLKAGMNDHINKPISLRELFQVLAKWIQR